MISLFISQADLPHVFPASRLSISALEGQLQDLRERFISLKSLAANDPQLLPDGYILPTVCCTAAAITTVEMNSHSTVVEIDVMMDEAAPPPPAAAATTPNGAGTTIIRTESDGSTTLMLPSKKLYEIANMKSSLREGLVSDGRRNFQHFDNVKDTVIVSSSIGGDDEMLNSQVATPISTGSTSLSSRQVEKEAVDDTAVKKIGGPAAEIKVIMKGTKQQLMLASFMEDVTVKLNEMELLLNDISEKYYSVLCYCGEDPELSLPDFFSTLHTFCGVFDEAKRFVDRQNRSKERQRLLERKKRNKKKAAAAEDAKATTEEKDRE